jgi:hypothetical protein
MAAFRAKKLLREMRDRAREIFYLVGTAKGKIREYEKKVAGVTDITC